MIIGVGCYYLITVGMSVRLQSAKNVKKERVLHVGDNDSQGAASSPGQRAGVQVGVIFQV